MAGATVTPHPPLNQDAFATWSEPGSAGVVVADGLGSLPRSGEASAAAADTVAGLLRRPEGAPAAAIGLASATAAGILAGQGLTTVLSARALAIGVELAWVGNGAILQVCKAPWSAAGSAALDPVSTLLWTNLLIPHISFEDGRDRLSRVVGGDRPPAVDRMVVEVTRPTAFLVVSDGIHTSEQAEVGRDDAGERWQQVSSRLHRVLACAAAVLDPSADLEAEPVLAGALAELLAAGELCDDATVAALVVVPPGAQR